MHVVHSHDRNAAKWRDQVTKGFSALPQGLRDTQAGQTDTMSLKSRISQLLCTTQNGFLLEKKKKHISLDNPSPSALLFSLLAPSANIIAGPCLCFVSAREPTTVKKPVLILAHPRVYFYDAFQLSKEKEEVFCFYIFKTVVYVGLMTAFISVRTIRKTPWTASNWNCQSSMSFVCGDGKGSCSKLLSTAGEQVSGYNITTPFWHCYRFDFSSSKMIFFP